MKCFRKIILLAWIAMISESLLGQQDPMFNQYAFNTVSLNPAYAGASGNIRAIAVSRFQWVGIEDAPITHSANIHAPVTDKLALGLSVIQDNIGPTKQFFGFADIAYHLPVSRKANLSFGIKAGFIQFNTNLNELGLLNDPELSGGISDIKPNIGAGAYYHTDKFYIGFSVPRLMESEFGAATGSVQSYRRHSFLILGYIGKLSDNLQFKPTSVIKAVEGAPLSFDITPTFILKEKFVFGPTFRNSSELGALVQYWFNERFRVGYAYDIPTNAIRGTSGSHEIMLGLDIPQTSKKQGRNYSPRFF